MEPGAPGGRPGPGGPGPGLGPGWAPLPPGPPGPGWWPGPGGPILGCDICGLFSSCMAFAFTLGVLVHPSFYALCCCCLLQDCCGPLFAPWPGPGGPPGPPF